MKHNYNKQFDKRNTYTKQKITKKHEKGSAHTEKDAVQRQCTWRQETEYFLPHSEWHYGASSFIGGRQTQYATNPFYVPSICRSASNVSAVQLIQPTLLTLPIPVPILSCLYPVLPCPSTSLSASFIAYILILILLLYPSLSLSCCILILNLPS